MPRDRRPDSEPITGLASLSLCDLIVRLDPRKLPPYHLNPLPQLLERALNESLRVLASPPVRHTKSTTCFNAIVYWLLRNPRLEISYRTFDFEFAQRNSRTTRSLALLAGVPLSSDHNTIKEWRTDAGGGVYWSSTGQENQGRGADIYVFDDALGWLDRNDPDVQQQVDDDIQFAVTRLSPGGSIFVVGSRSGRMDPIGRRTEGRAREWLLVASPAIIDENGPEERALWPEGRPLDHLKAIREELTERGDVAVWRSQYQGEPIADSAGVFIGATDYDYVVPTTSVIVGVDAAFTRGRGADWFVAVPMADFLDASHVLNVVRHQRGTQAIVESLGEMRTAYPGCRFVSYVSGPERGVYELIFNLGIEVEMMPARWNKGVRARQCAHAWGKGRVRIPQHAPWRTGYLARMHSFAGVGDEVDDEPDATVAGHDALQAGRPVVGFGSGFMFGRPVL